MRVFGIDYGEKRVGIAVADTAAPIAVPRETLRNDGKLIDTLVKRAKADSIEQFVVGLPLLMDGEESALVEVVRAFGDALAERTGIPVSYVDERLSSQQAEKLGAPDIDAAAAAAILQSWLQMQGKVQ